MYIYKTTNLINDKFYIGKCVRSVEKSIEYLGSGKLILLAIKKYGKGNFKKEILEHCDKDKLGVKETYWIDKMNALDKSIAYNIGTGGEGNDNFTHHPNKELIREKLSKTHSGKIQSKEHIQKRIEKNTGQTRSLETKKKMSKSGKRWHKNNPGAKSGKNNGMYGVHRYGKDAPMYGKKMTDSAKQKIREKALSRDKTNYINAYDHLKREVIQKDLDGNIIKMWESVNAAKKSVGSSIYDAISGRQKTAYGYLWEYKNVSK